MTEIIDTLARMKSSSSSKSYIIGLERGRMWAMDSADFFQMKEWTDFGGEDFVRVALPDDEERHYHVLKAETELEWGQYVKGWIDGVKEAARK
jgi:hypothetical protein